MSQPRILILRAPGTNCDVETKAAFELAGGQADRVHVNRLLENPALIGDYQILCVAGGFSYGDDVAAGRILANQIRHHLADVLQSFRDDGKLILGICNGFQVLIKSGMLLADADDGQAAATLTWNDTGKFEDRWVQLAASGDKSVFLRDIEQMYLPIAHAEGKFVSHDDPTLDALRDSGQLVLSYRSQSGADTAAYPDNPNGSQHDVAGVCDTTGRVLGMMPHPERYVDRTQHPRWTRGEAGEVGDGLKVFENAVAYFA